MRDAKEVERRLRAAIGTGEVVGICYHGGSQPGAYREVIPLQINGDQVRMRCRTSGAAKTFSIAKIEIKTAPPETGDGQSTWNNAPAPLSAAYSTVAEIEAAHRAEIEALGWRVVAETGPDGDFLCLFKATKAGKLLKHPHIVLGFEPMTSDLSHTREGETIRTNFRPRVRPWSVRSKSGSCGTWAGAAKAVEVLLSEAAPGP
jgi:hypothetical protein